MVHAVVVVLLDNEAGGVEIVHPVGDLLIVGALPRNGVDQHRALHVRAAEQADGPHQTGADPVGDPLLVDLHHRLGKEVGGEVEAEVAVEVAAEVLHVGVLDPLLQPHQLHVLGDHVDEQIGGQAVGAVGEPLDEVHIRQRGDAHRAAPVVDLGVVVDHVKLADHVAELAQLPVPQPLGGLPVQHGDLIVGDLVHLSGKVAHLDGQQLGVVLGPEDDRAYHAAADAQQQGQNSYRHRNQALSLQELEVPLHPLALKAAGEHGAAAVDDAQQQDEGVKLRGLEVDGRQVDVEVYESHRQCHGQIDEHPGDGAFYRLAGLFRLGRAVLGGCAAGKSLPLKALGVLTGKWHDVSPFSCGSK